MTYFMCLFLLGLATGMVGVAANPAPIFATMALVGVAGAGCGILVGYGASFLSLMLLLIYLGGMLVVLAYSTALAGDRHLRTWAAKGVMRNILGYAILSQLLFGVFWENWHEGCWTATGVSKEFGNVQGDFSGVALLYSSGGEMLLVCAGVLLMTLFIVLELTRGLARAAVRAI
nr:NADH dehydrogenase subunit 6 [Photonectes albipennis]